MPTSDTRLMNKSTYVTRSFASAAVAGSLLVLTACSDRSENAMERSAENASDSVAAAYEPAEAAGAPGMTASFEGIVAERPQGA